MILGVRNPIEDMPGLHAMMVMGDEFKEHVQCKTVVYAVLSGLKTSAARISSVKELEGVNLRPYPKMCNGPVSASLLNHQPHFMPISNKDIFIHVMDDK
jgi:hypothetical protein